MLKEEDHRALSGPEPRPCIAPDSRRSEPFSTCVQTKSLAQLNYSKQVSKQEGKSPLT